MKTARALSQQQILRCALCGEKHSRLTYKLHIMFDKKQLETIRKDHPHWTDKEGACFICANIYRREFGLAPLSKEEFYALWC